MQNRDTKKEISIPKRRLRPPRYHKTDISIFDEKVIFCFPDNHTPLIKGVTVHPLN